MWKKELWFHTKTGLRCRAFPYLCGVRLTYIILAVYIFLCALYPCTDSDMHTGPIQEGIAILSDHDHSHSGVELDICSPFCICSCCSANIRLSVPNQIEQTYVEHNTVLISQYIEHPVLDVSLAIWQPPKLKS